MHQVYSAGGSAAWGPEQALGPLVTTQRWPGNQILMNPYGTIHFATASEQIAQREVCLHGFTVDFKHLHENIDCLVGLFVQQIIQTPEIGRRPVVSGRFPGFAAALCSQPAGSGGNGVTNGTLLAYSVR